MKGRRAKCSHGLLLKMHFNDLMTLKSYVDLRAAGALHRETLEVAELFSKEQLPFYAAVRRMGFTHVEALDIAEAGFFDTWPKHRFWQLKAKCGDSLEEILKMWRLSPDGKREEALRSSTNRRPVAV